MSSDHVFQAEPAPKPSGSKLWLYLGLGCGGMLLLCCGGIGLFSWWVYGVAKSTVITTPDQIAAIQREVAQVDLPPRFEPLFAVDLSSVTSKFGVPPEDGMLNRAVWYGSRQGDEGAMAMLFEVKGGSPEIAEQSRDMAESMAQGNAPQSDVPDAAQQVNAETHTVTINGEEAQFNIIEYRDETAGRSYWQAHGAFKNDVGWVYFVLHDQGENIDRDQIIEILDSIQ
jgi:hypothetical protein